MILIEPRIIDVNYFIICKNRFSLYFIPFGLGFYNFTYYSYFCNMCPLRVVCIITIFVSFNPKEK